MRIGKNHVKAFVSCFLIALLISMHLVGCLDLSELGQPKYNYIPVNTKEELFKVVNDAIYTFEDTICVKTKDYDTFKELWQQLDSEKVLHTVFRSKFYQVRYQNKKDECQIQILMTMNPCGEALQYLYTKKLKEYKTPEAKKLGDNMMRVIDEIIKPDMTEEQKVREIHDYIVSHFEYAVGGDVDDFAQAEVLFDQNRGQCQAYSELFVALCLLSGVEARIVSGQSSIGYGYGETGHAWCQVKINSLWYHVDPTWDDPVPDEGKNVRYDYYLKGDLALQRTHEWSSLFEICYVDYSS